jgi:hypothetical protein
MAAEHEVADARSADPDSGSRASDFGNGPLQVQVVARTLGLSRTPFSGAGRLAACPHGATRPRLRQLTLRSGQALRISLPGCGGRASHQPPAPVGTCPRLVGLPDGPVRRPGSRGRPWSACASHGCGPGEPTGPCTRTARTRVCSSNSSASALGGPAGQALPSRPAYVEPWTIALWGVAAARCRPLALGR